MIVLHIWENFVRLFGYTYFRIEENMQRAIMVIKNVITQRDGDTECWPCCPHVWKMAYPPHLKIYYKFTFARIDGFLSYLALLDLSVGLDGKLVFNFLVRIGYFSLLLVFLGQSKGGRPRQFLYVFNTVVLAAQHSRIRRSCANADLLTFVDHVETTNDLLIAFESA